MASYWLRCTGIFWQSSCGYGYPGIIPGWPMLLRCTGILWHTILHINYANPGTLMGQPLLLWHACQSNSDTSKLQWPFRGHPWIYTVTLAYYDGSSLVHGTNEHVCLGKNVSSNQCISNYMLITRLRSSVQHPWAPQLLFECCPGQQNC